MEKTNITEIITKYFKAVCDAYSLGNVESSYNAPIMTLFTDIGCAARDLSGERKGQSGENIDIKLWHTEEEVTETEPFAGVEVKKVGGIDKRALSQIKIEADRYGNAILTDNIEWRFWRAGDTEMYTGLRIMELVDGKLVLREDNIELFFSLLEDFLLRDPAQIKSSTKLAEYMAMHARTIRSIISGILKDDGNPTFRGMRGSLLRTFDKIYIINLHGSANKKETGCPRQRETDIHSIKARSKDGVFYSIRRP